MPKFPFPEAELPQEGAVEGASGLRRPGGGRAELPRIDELRTPRPGIEELPWGPDYGRVHALVQEVFSLRQRVYKLESSALFTQLGLGGYRGGVVGAPNELPAELEYESYSSGRPHIRGEINEFPPPDSIFQQIASLESRFAALEVSLLNAIQGLTAKVEGSNR